MIVLSYNIQYGFGADGRYDLKRVADVLQGADIIALQEVDRHWTRSNLQDQPALLERFLPEYHTVYGPAFDMDASVVQKDRVQNRRRQFGPMILSRWPIVWSRLHLLPLTRMDDPLNTQTGAIEACIATPFGALRVMNVHLAHVGVEERLEQVRVLRGILDRADRAGPPWSGTDDEPARCWTEGQREPPNPASLLLMGDFNCERRSAEFSALLGEFPYHPGARYHAGLTDVVSHVKTRLYTHLKVIAGETRRRQLDHIFASSDLRPGIRLAWTDYDILASDHFPLWAEILMPAEPPRRLAQPSPAIVRSVDVS